MLIFRVLLDQRGLLAVIFRCSKNTAVALATGCLAFCLFKAVRLYPLGLPPSCANYVGIMPCKYESFFSGINRHKNEGRRNAGGGGGSGRGGSCALREERGWRVACGLLQAA